MSIPTFICAPCNFETALKANFTRHMKTTKHIEYCKCNDISVDVPVKQTKREPESELLKKINDLMQIVLIQSKDIAELKMLMLRQPTLQLKKHEPVAVVEPVVELVVELVVEPVVELVVELVVEPVVENIILQDIVIEVLEPVVEKEIIIFVEPVVEKIKRKKSNIILLDDDVDISMNDLLLEKMKSNMEIEKMKIEAETAKMKMAFELERLRLKAKAGEETVEDIINKYRYGMKTEVSFRKDNMPNANGSMWEIIQTLNITEHELDSIANSYTDDNDKKNKETKINLFIDKLTTTIENIEESKRPMIVVNNKLYTRNIVELDHYEWNEERINDLIEKLEYEYMLYKNRYTLTDEKSMNFNQIIYATLMETDYKKILKSLMPLIQKGK